MTYWQTRTVELGVGDAVELNDDDGIFGIISRPGENTFILKFRTKGEVPVRLPLKERLRGLLPAPRPQLPEGKR